MSTERQAIEAARARYREALLDLIVRASEELREQHLDGYSQPSDALGGTWDRCVTARVTLRCTLP